MGAPVVTQATTVMCGHAGSVTHTPTQVRVRVAGALVAVASDPFVVAGCTLLPAPICVTLVWTVPAVRVKVGGQPVLTHSSMPVGIGPALVVAGQMRVTVQ